MKTTPNTHFRFATCCVLVAAIFLVIGAAPAMAAPVVVQSASSAADGVLKDVAIAGTGTQPYPTTDTTLTPLGSNTGIQYNNMGWRPSDGLLYALEADVNGSTGNMLTISPTTGLITTTTAISGGSASLTSGVTYDAGDVNTDLDVLYISRLTVDNNLYIADLTSPTFALSSLPITGITGNNLDYVADWAYDPNSKNLYGMDRDGDWATINLVSGERTEIADEIAGNATYGAAWYDPATEDIFVYGNSPSGTGAAIFQVDPTTGGRINTYGATGTALHDGAYVGAAVPIPGAVWLLGSGLMGMVAIRKKKRG